VRGIAAGAVTLALLAFLASLPAHSLPAHAAPAVCPTGTAAPRALIAGDSWAQFMWDDGYYNVLFDQFGHADKRMISRSLGSDPGPGYTGPEYAVSGSEARQWADPLSYPWIANMTAELAANPTIDTVVLSIGGNDVLAGRSDGGWYKQMDLDVPGSEAALFDTIAADTRTIIDAAQAVPGVDVLLSSYEYPNFNVSVLWCWIYACPKRDDLSRDPVNALVTDQELNAMTAQVELLRIGWSNADPRLFYDNSVGLMHHYYGDGVSAPGVLPRPGLAPPDYSPFPAGNPLRPTLRANFRPAAGIPADPIHLGVDEYQYKITHQIAGYFFPRFRGTPSATFFSEGGTRDGWADGSSSGTDAIRVGDDGAGSVYGIASFDTSAIPDGAQITAASVYFNRSGGSGANPFQTGDLGLPTLDLATGSFGGPEVEPGDATAPASAANVGCVHGSAAELDYAVRVDLTPAGLAAINAAGLTQLRFSFPGVDAGADQIDFATGDGTLRPLKDRITEQRVLVDELTADGGWITREKAVLAIDHQGLAELMGTAAPFLDVTWTEISSEIFTDGFESGDAGQWSATVP
jgi:hypothetical protein